MSEPPASASLRRTGNNFGFLRLVFALLVIVSHSPTLVDGDNSRELWSRTFGSFTFGGVAVDGFFLISGYLITKSFETSKTISDYLLKRVLRIYPGYMVAFVMSFAVVGYLAGGDLAGLSLFAWFREIIFMLLLNNPDMPGVFAGLHFPHLNGSLWTIAYEFRCYLLVIVFGAIGLLKKRWLYLILTLSLIPIGLTQVFDLRMPFEMQPYKNVIPYYYFPNVSLNDSLRFIPIFMVGGAFYLFRDRIVYTRLGAIVAAIALLPSLFVPPLVEPALAIFGGYLLFWFSFCAAKFLNRVGNKTDLSYGIYLYAWPVQNLLIFYIAGISPWMVTVLTSAIAAGLAFASWTLVEYPCLQLKDRLRINPRRATVTI